MMNYILTSEDKQKILEAKKYIAECREKAAQMVADKSHFGALQENQKRIDNALSYIRQIESGVPEFFTDNKEIKE